MSELSAEQVAAARDWAAGVRGCTCQVVMDEATGRYGVPAHDCPHCREWGRRLADLVTVRVSRAETGWRHERKSRRRAA